MNTSYLKSVGATTGYVVACALLAFATSCSRSEKTIPTDAKARSEFFADAATKMNPDDRKLIDRFAGRLEARESAGNRDTTSSITVTRALELERNYEAQVANAQKSLQEKLAASQASVRIEVQEPKLVKPEKSRSAADRSLRYVVSVSNRGSKTVDRIALRIEIREASGKYQAAIPNLQLGGPLKPGETGRSVQLLALDPQRHQYILDGKPLQISAYPMQIAYADGDKLDPGAELQTLESLHHAKIE